MNNSKDLVFVYLGNKLPKYAVSSLKIASSTSGMNVCIIGNRSIEKSVAGLPVAFVPIEDFYDATDFLMASSHVWADHHFRGGLWLKSLERLFVLFQYMVFTGKTSLMHAELDQLIFQIAGLCSALDELNYKGLFIPFHDEVSAVASVLYINDLDAFRSLLEFAVSDVFYPNEMFLISKWAHRHPDKIFELPTVASQVQNRLDSIVPGSKLLTINQTQGLVDAAQIGQWVAGIDPKNVSISAIPVNKFVDRPKRYLLDEKELQSITFRLDSSHELFLSTKKYSGVAKLYNLHIHSKIHSELLCKSFSLHHLIELANSSEVVRLPGTRRQQIKGWAESRLAKVISSPFSVYSTIISKLYKKIGLRCSSKPYISGDSFRLMADLIWERDSKFTIAEVFPGCVIFCESDYLEDLDAEVLRGIARPIVLILGNSDRNIDKTVIEKVHLIPGSSIFAQNLVGETVGVNPLPIGLENRWRVKNGRVLPFRILSLIGRKRKAEILWGFSIQTNPEERSRAALALKRVSVARPLGAVSAFQHRLELTKSMFVASPPGNGIDTHRTWEAMYLGCIPVIQDSYLSRYYKSIGLPVWVLNSYEELIDISESELRSKYKEIMSTSRSDELFFAAWENKIKEHSSRIANPQQG